jgi:hypothetical protein
MPRGKVEVEAWRIATAGAIEDHVVIGKYLIRPVAAHSFDILAPRQTDVYKINDRCKSSGNISREKQSGMSKNCQCHVEIGKTSITTT